MGKKEQRSKYITQVLETYFEEVEPMEFYRDIFPEGSFERKGEFQQGKYNAIIREITNEHFIDKAGREKRHVNRYIVTDELDQLKTVIERNTDEFCIMQPVSYAGKSATAKNARELYAMAFDLDGIKIKELGDDTDGLENLFYQIDESEVLPVPTYICMSGTGLHIYYVFDKPIKLYNHVMEELTKLKTELTAFLWYGSISYLDYQVQYEPIVQPFRVVGTHTKIGTKVRAFRYGSGDRVTIDYLNQFVLSKYQANIDERAERQGLTLAEAKEKYPEWYEKRIIKGEKKSQWTFNRGVYDKWLERLKTDNNQRIHFGNRYWSVFILAATAKKCKIPFETLEEDAYNLVPILNGLEKSEPFTDEDAMAALKGYDEKYITLSVDFINTKCDRILTKNKRNGRKQAQHVKIMNAIRDLDYPNGEWRNKDGRPKGSGTKQEQVQAWRKNNPKGTKAQCIRDTGISKPTVYKWWDIPTKE